MDGGYLIDDSGDYLVDDDGNYLIWGDGPAITPLIRHFTRSPFTRSPLVGGGLI